MKWTKEAPTEPGWYWFRDIREPDAVLLCRDVGPDGKLFCKFHVRGMGIMVDQMDGEWWPKKIELPESKS